MAKTKGVYDGFQFDCDVPLDRPVTGEEIKAGMAQALGRIPDGATAIRRSTGDLEHIAAQDRIQVEPGDSVTVTPTFETAGRGSRIRLV